MPKLQKNAGYEPISKHLTVDVAIIGGGLAGVSAAYFLSRSGARVAVLEAKAVGSGATSMTTAFLTQVIDTSITDLVSMFGELKTREIWESHGQAIEAVEQVINREGIDCGFMRCPNYYYSNTTKDFKELEKEHETCRELGINMRLSRLNNLPFRNHGYIEVPNQAKFDAGKYLAGLAKAAAGYGAKIYENTEAKKISRTGNAVWEIDTASGARVTASDVIIATYYPMGNPKSTFLKKGMYVSYVLELQISKDVLSEAIYEDTANPYNYFRVDAGEKYDTMLIGGQDHRAELKLDSEKGFKAMEDYVKRTFPDLRYKIASKWTGPILEPIDGLALIGEAAEHEYVATAFSGNGMTYSTISGMLLCDLVRKVHNPWQELYDPKRIPSLKQLAKKGRDYTEEFFSGGFKAAFR